jgi:hypothetical protein
MSGQRMFSTGEVNSLVRGNLIAWGAVAVIFCVIPAALVYAAVPQFRTLYGGFGADLPDSTMFLLEWRILLWVTPALTLLLLGSALTTSPDKAIEWHRRVVAAFAVLCSFSMIVEGLAVIALYAPIFRLSAVV